MSWRDYSRKARFWKAAPDSGGVECTLCPRHCRPEEGGTGFCGVRSNLSGALHTLNYGRSVQATIESIESEAVYHYRPGERILSLGNIGCMMHCTFCQNWETSQVVNLDAEHVFTYTPRQVVDLAREHDIKVLSWTYNDPVVWHEFVVDTARLAARQGIRNLYKSALYVEREPLRELCEVIDVFSISLKSMSPSFYRTQTRGRLQPVLDAIQTVRDSGRHLEVSHLLVTGLNDLEDQVRDLARWTAEHLGPDIPLHLVRFHPAYRYTAVGRTPLSKLVRARRIALQEGVRYCYLGNVYQSGVSDTRCHRCGHLQVSRFGLSVSVSGLEPDGRCRRCREPSPILGPFQGLHDNSRNTDDRTSVDEQYFAWTEEANSLHLVALDAGREIVEIHVTRRPTGVTQALHLGRGLTRAIISRASPREEGVVIRGERPLAILPLLDRAHFPVKDGISIAASGPPEGKEDTKRRHSWTQ